MKKILFLVMVVFLLVALIPTSASAATVGTNAVVPPDDGAVKYKTETIYITNKSIQNHSTAAMTASGASELFKSHAFSKAIFVGSAASSLAAYINDNHGNSGFKITVDYKYETRDVFDGTWVEHTGWFVVDHTISTY